MQQQHTWSRHRHMWQHCCTLLCSTTVTRAVMTHLLHCCSTQSLSDAQPPPLTAVWDPPMELLGGQGQRRAGYQQSPPPLPPSPHRGGGGHCKPAQDAGQWVGCHEGGPLDPHVLQAGHNQSHSSHHRSVPPPLPVGMAVLPFPPQRPDESLCIALLWTPGAPQDPAALPTPGSPSALTANSLSGSFGPFLKGRE